MQYYEHIDSINIYLYFVIVIVFSNPIDEPETKVVNVSNS